MGEDNSNAASLRSGRSVGRGGGDRYDMHAASEEEDSASVQSDKEEREGPIEGGRRSREGVIRRAAASNLRGGTRPRRRGGDGGGYDIC